MSEPPRTAGYSGTPLPKKLGIKPGSRVLLMQAPGQFGDTVGTLPAGASIVGEDGAPVDVALFFTSRPVELRAHFPGLARLIKPDGGLWIAWPKRRRGVAPGISENSIREIGLAAGLVDNKVCAIDDHWSGLRFVYRLKDRPR